MRWQLEISRGRVHYGKEAWALQSVSCLPILVINPSYWGTAMHDYGIFPVGHSPCTNSQGTLVLRVAAPHGKESFWKMNKAGE